MKIREKEASLAEIVNLRAWILDVKKSEKEEAIE